MRFGDARLVLCNPNKWIEFVERIGKILKTKYTVETFEKRLDMVVE